MDFLSTMSCTIIMATHDINSAIALTDRVIVLNHTIRSDGAYHELLSDTSLLVESHLELPDIPSLFTVLKAEGSWEEEIPIDEEGAIELLRVHMGGGGQNSHESGDE